MPIWRVKPIAESPEIILDNWTIFEVSTPLWAGKTRHFVGYNVGDREGRVSSAIVEFDAEKMLGKTCSGRVYKLAGSQGDGSADALHTWGLWCRRNEIAECRVVDPGRLAEMELIAGEIHEAATCKDYLQVHQEGEKSGKLTEAEQEELHRVEEALKWFC
jgi:hypothetical protein